MITLKFEKFDIKKIEPHKRYLVLKDYESDEGFCCESTHSDDIFYDFNDIDYPNKKNEFIGYIPYSDTLISLIRTSGDTPAEYIRKGWYLLTFKYENVATYDLLYFDKEVKSSDLYYNTYNHQYSFTPETRKAGATCMFDIRIVKLDTSNAYKSVKFWDNDYSAEGPFDKPYRITTKQEIFELVEKAYDNAYGNCSDLWLHRPSKRLLRKLIKIYYTKNPKPSDKELADFIKSDIINRPITLTKTFYPGQYTQYNILDMSQYLIRGIPVHGSVGAYSF
jgi:hypothetical protein